jgi:hypothetical protein
VRRPAQLLALRASGSMATKLRFTVAGHEVAASAVSPVAALRAKAAAPSGACRRRHPGFSILTSHQLLVGRDFYVAQEPTRAGCAEIQHADAGRLVLFSGVVIEMLIDLNQRALDPRCAMIGFPPPEVSAPCRPQAACCGRPGSTAVARDRLSVSYASKLSHAYLALAGKAAQKLHLSAAR